MMDVAKASTTDLQTLSAALRMGRLSPPYTSARVQSVLNCSAADVLASVCQSFAEQGFTPEQLAITLDVIAKERSAQTRHDDAIELVTTGPEARGIINRDTGVVVRDLFANAERSVLVAGYAVYQGQRVFQALADRMQERPDLKVRLFFDIQRGMGDTSLPSELMTRFGVRFRTQQWPTGRPTPTLYYDPRSLDLAGTHRACLHAKCIVVDESSVFISSANFTQAAQERNIEVGLLLSSQVTATKLTHFFETMIEERLLLPVP